MSNVPFQNDEEKVKFVNEALVTNEQGVRTFPRAAVVEFYEKSGIDVSAQKAFIETGKSLFGTLFSKHVNDHRADIQKRLSAGEDVKSNPKTFVTKVETLEGKATFTGTDYRNHQGEIVALTGKPKADEYGTQRVTISSTKLIPKATLKSAVADFKALFEK
jgi:hypothetical protein